MKHLIKFNENNGEDYKKVFEDYLKICFIDFYDDGTDIYSRWEEDDIMTLTIQFRQPVEETDDINNFIEHANYLAEVYSDIGVCIEGLKIKYPNVSVDYKYIFGNYTGYYEYGAIKMIFSEI